MLRRVSFLVVLFALHSLAAGEDEDFSPSVEAEIEVTATRMAQSLSTTGASVTVVTSEDLRARQVRLAEDALLPVPGAYVNMGGPPGSATSLFIRGAGSNQSVVLIDGIQVNDPTIGGQYNFYDLTVDNVERIEVLRGSASSLYGSDAIGGVVNVVSRPVRGGPGVDIGIEGGSYGYYRFGLFAQAEIDELAFNLTAGKLRYRNELPNNEFTDLTFAGNLELDLGAGFVLGLRGRFIDSDAEDPWDFPFGEQIEKDPNIRRERTTALVGLRLDHDASEAFSLRLDTSWFDVDSLFRNGPDATGAPKELESRAIATVYNATLTGTLRRRELSDWLGASVLGGLEYEDEVSENRLETSFGPSPDLDETVRNRAAFLILETEWWMDFIASGGIRHDRNSFFGGVTTFSASLLYDLGATGTRLRANYGEGFRAPKPVEFGDPFVGNPELGAEESVSFDFGVEQELLDGDLELSATWFQLKTSGLIAYDFDSMKLMNFARTRTRGWELSLAARPDDAVLVRGWLTLQDPRDLTTGDRLPGRPKNFGGGEVRYAGTGWWASFEVISSGDFSAPVKTTPNGNVRNHPGRKLLFAIRGSYEISPDVRLSARLENLTDYRWYDSVTAPDGLGRGIYLGIDIEL